MATSRLCSIPGCNKPARSRGWCSAHYQRWLNRGPSMKCRTPPGERIRFAREEAALSQSDECLIWPFQRNSNGYGVVTVDGKRQPASRYICLLANGHPPTPSHHAAHSCGNGHLGCVNPRHLSWKTVIENHADKRIHGTVNRGSRNGRAKIKESDIKKIRHLKDKHTTDQIAEMFGIPRGTAWNIINGKSWRWVK